MVALLERFRPVSTPAAIGAAVAASLAAAEPVDAATFQFQATGPGGFATTLFLDDATFADDEPVDDAFGLFSSLPFGAGSSVTYNGQTVGTSGGSLVVGNNPGFAADFGVLTINFDDPLVGGEQFATITFQDAVAPGLAFDDPSSVLGGVFNDVGFSVYGGPRERLDTTSYTNGGTAVVPAPAALPLMLGGLGLLGGLAAFRRQHS